MKPMVVSKTYLLGGTGPGFFLGGGGGGSLAAKVECVVSRVN